MSIPVKIRLFGAGCERCTKAEQIIEEFFEKREIPITFEKINDVKEMVSKGIVVTPAIEINVKLLFHGRIPKINELDTWLTQYLHQQ